MAASEAPPRLHLCDLPPELLEKILSLLSPDLDRVVELAGVCRVFREVAFRIPVIVHIPVSDERMKILTEHRVPVATLANKEPTVFVAHQIGALNLKRLSAAELESGDYLTHKPELSPHYVDLLTHLLRHASKSLRHLVANADLVTYGDETFRCAEILSRFSNLTFLSLAFNTKIELQQKVLSRSDGSDMIRQLVSRLPKLSTLYLFNCPTERLIIHSGSLERLHIYRSEFAGVAELRTPNLIKLIFHQHVREVLDAHKAQTSPMESDDSISILGVLYDGCPVIKCFNHADLSQIRGNNLERKDWCQKAYRICLETYKEIMDSYKPIYRGGDDKEESD